MMNATEKNEAGEWRSLKGNRNVRQSGECHQERQEETGILDRDSLPTSGTRIPVTLGPVSTASRWGEGLISLLETYFFLQAVGLRWGENYSSAPLFSKKFYLSCIFCYIYLKQMMNY